MKDHRGQKANKQNETSWKHHQSIIALECCHVVYALQSDINITGLQCTSVHVFNYLISSMFSLNKVCFIASHPSAVSLSVTERASAAIFQITTNDSNLAMTQRLLRCYTVRDSPCGHTHTATCRKTVELLWKAVV